MKLILRHFTLTFFVLFSCVSNPGKAQTNESLLLLHPQIGTEVDSTMKSNYHLFPFVSKSEFKRAHFVQRDENIFLVVFIKSGKTREVLYTINDFDSTKKIIAEQYSKKQKYRAEEKPSADPVNMNSPVDPVKMNSPFHSDNIQDVVKPEKLIDKNAFYLELLGPGLLYSIVYDRYLYAIEYFKWDARIGINALPGFASINAGSGILFFGSKRMFELGAGFTLLANGLMVEDFTKPNSKVTNHYFWTNLGYRYQKLLGGFSFKINYTPMYLFNSFKSHAGISFGYAF